MLTTKEYIEISTKSPFYNTYEGCEKDKELMIEYNKALIEKYPFLLPRNRWSGKVIDNYDYSYTEIDCVPAGWRIAFGDRMLEELREELVKYNFLDKYRILEIKEKYGMFRWYDGGTPIGKLSEDYEAIDVKYGDPYPKYDFKTEYIEEIGKDNYIEAKDSSEYFTPEFREKNKNCIIHYAKRKILEKCRLYEIINSYERLSSKVCIDCGAQNVPLYISTGWVNFICKNCAEKRLAAINADRESDYVLEDLFILPKKGQEIMVY